MGPSAPGEPFSPGGPGGPAGPGSPGRPAGPVSPRGPLPPSLPLGPGGPGRPMLPWVGVCGGGDAVRLMPQLRAPPSPSPLAEGQPGASRCQVGQGGRVEPAGPVPGIPTVPAPSCPPPPPATRLTPSGGGHGTHRGAGGSNSSSSTRETSSTLQGGEAGVRRGAASWHRPRGPGPGDRPLAEGHHGEPQEESAHPRGWGAAAGLGG